MAVVLRFRFGGQLKLSESRAKALTAKKYIFGSMLTLAGKKLQNCLGISELSLRNYCALYGKRDTKYFPVNLHSVNMF